MVCGFQPQMRDCWGKILQSAQKLKLKCYLFLLSLLGDCGGGSSCPEAVPGVIFSLCLSMSLLQTHKTSCSSPAYLPEVLPRGPKGMRGLSVGTPRVLQFPPPAEPQSPRMGLLGGNSLPKGCRARKESNLGEGSFSLSPGRMCWDRSSSPAPTLQQKQAGAELSAEACW